MAKANHQIDTALIYAAGRGTRMGTLTKTTPKPLLKLNDKALIDYAVERVREAGIKNIHVNAAYLAEQICDHFKNTDIKIHLEPDGPYETGGTLKSLANQLPDAIVTLNADVLFFEENPIPALIKTWQNQTQWDALLTLLPREFTLGHEGKGDFFWRDQILSRRGLHPTAPYIYPSVQIIRPKTALEIPETIFSTNRIWDNLIANGRIGGLVYEGAWMDLGNAQSLQRAQKELKTQ